MKLFLFLLLLVLPTIPLHGQTSRAKVKVYWDVSLSMEKRDLEKELIFLDKYVKDNRIESIKLVQFSNTIKNTKEFTLVDGNISSIATYLSEIAYEGISDMDFLVKEDSDVPSLLFTEGRPRLKELKPHYGKSNMVVVCATNTCNPVLQRLSLYSRGSYHELLPQKKNSNDQKKSSDEILITGLVSDATGPLEGTEVVCKGRAMGTLTLKDGSFAIKVRKGDSLLFQYLGKRSIVLPVKSTSRFFEVTLEERTENLDEVVLVQKKKIKWLPKEKVLGYGGTQTIEKKDLTVSSGSLNESLAGKVAGVQTNKDGFERSIIRGFSSIEYSNFPLIIIDGAPMPKPAFQGSRNVNTDVMNMVNPNDVLSVKVIRGLAAANRYGSEGANGVILITTRYGKVKLNKENTSKATNTALVKNNNFEGDLNVVPDYLDIPYLNDIKEQTTPKGAYAAYLKGRDAHANDPYYFINVHNLFKTTDTVLAERILNSGLAVSSNDIPVLRTIAFYHQEAQRYDQSAALYRKIVELDSSSVQAYRDVANAQVQSGRYQEALDSYLTMVQSDFLPVLAPKSIADVVHLELRNLIYRKGKDLDLGKVPSKFRSKPRYDARVVLEWNNPQLDFEVEFISPFKKISKWSHTASDNPKRLQEELRYGFNLEETLLSQVQKGDWYLNIRTINHNRNTPLFLKCSVYYYYGQAGQYNVQEVFSFPSGTTERLVTKFSIK